MTDFEMAVSFIKSIGIGVQFEPIEENCFLPGLSIRDGHIIVDREKLKYPGDILHEAGHIAVVPQNERSTLNEKDIALRSMREAEEMMAIAWSYAACVHLHIDAGFVLHDEGYKGGGSSIAANFSQGHYFGVPMLQWTGMAIEKSTDGGQAYPNMLKWLRD
jgi:hypothetical protein